MRKQTRRKLKEGLNSEVVLQLVLLLLSREAPPPCLLGQVRPFTY